MNLASSRRNWPTGRGFERFYGFLGAETNQWYPGAGLRQPSRRPAAHAGGGLPPDRGPHRQGARVHQGRQGDRARQAVLPLLRAGRLPRAAPRAEGVDRPLQGPLRHGLRGDARADARAPEGDGHRPARHRAAADQPDRHARDAHRARTASRSRRWTSRARGTRCRPRSSGCSAAWPRSTPASWRTPTTRSGGCWTTWRRPASARTRWSSWSPTTAPAARAARTGRSTRTSSSTGSPTTSPRTWRCSTSSAARRPTTTTPTAGRWRSTRRSRCGSATSSTAARRTRASSPGRPASRREGEIREQYHHAIDLVPTILDALGVEPPETIDGHVQSHFDGVSMRYSFDAAALPSARETQFYSMLGSRSIWHDGWKAVTTHPTISGWGHFDEDTWELYHTDVDRSELHDLAAAGARAPAGADQPVVRRGRRQRRVPARRPLARSRSSLTPRPLLSPAAQPLRLLPRRRRRARVPGGQHPQPLLRDRRARRHPRARAPRACCSRTARASAATPSTSRTTACTTSTTSSAASSRRSSPTEELPTGENLILSAAFEKDGEDPPGVAVGHAVALPRRREGRRGPHQDPAGQVLARRRRPLRRTRQQRPRHRATTPARAPWAFTGGTINRVAVDVSGEPYVDLEREAVAMMARE